MVNIYNDIFNLHKNVSDFFLQAIKNNSLSHAYLMHGRQGLAKFDFTKELAKIILSKPINELKNTSELKVYENEDSRLVDGSCHPNLIILEKEDKKNNISVEQIRQLFDFLKKTSYSDDKYKIVIVNSVDDLTVNASNALLKSLEEPSPFTLFFLICHNISKLLPTISSRCIKQSFNNLSSEQISDLIKSTDLDLSYIKDIEKISHFSEGSLFLLQKCADNKDFYNLIDFITNTLDNIKTVKAYDFITKITTLKTFTASDFVIILDIIQNHINKQNQDLESIKELLNTYKKDGITFNAPLKDMLINILITLKLQSVLS